MEEGTECRRVVEVLHPRPDGTDAFGDPKKNLPVADSSCCSRTLTGPVSNERSGVCESPSSKVEVLQGILGALYPVLFG